jgi:polyketide biosynthesis acyl carrier protein
MPTLGDTGRDEIADLVRGTITGIIPGLTAAGIDGSRHLKDLGADSVDRVEIIMSLIDALGLDADMSRFNAVPSVDALVDLLWREARS